MLRRPLTFMVCIALAAEASAAANSEGADVSAREPTERAFRQALLEQVTGSTLLLSNTSQLGLAEMCAQLRPSFNAAIKQHQQRWNDPAVADLEFSSLIYEIWDPVGKAERARAGYKADFPYRADARAARLGRATLCDLDKPIN